MTSGKAARLRLCAASAVTLSVSLLAVACGLALRQWPKRMGCGDEKLSWCCHDGPVELLPDDGVDYCELTGGGELSTADFMTKGYTVVRDWMPKEMIDHLMAIQENLGDARDVDPGKNGGATPGYRLPTMFGIDIFKDVPGLAKLIDDATKKVERETDIKVTYDGEYARAPVFFHTNASQSNSMMFGWHQDVENYFLFNDLYNYLDFYIMLDKPDPNAAGVMVVPFDKLKARAPALHSAVCKAKDRTPGAASFNVIPDNRTLVMESFDDSAFLLHFLLEEVACSPTLHAGDLLLFRGDTIHRTQPHQTYRTSLNVNVNSPHRKTLGIWDTLSGGLWKFHWMALTPGQYGALHADKASYTAFKSAVYAGYYYRVGLSVVRYSLGLLGI